MLYLLVQYNAIIFVIDNKIKTLSNSNSHHNKLVPTKIALQHVFWAILHMLVPIFIIGISIAQDIFKMLVYNSIRGIVSI